MKKSRNNKKYENKQSENVEDKISADFRKFLPYFIIEILGMRKVFQNKLSFMGAGFLIFCIVICKQIVVKSCKKHCISLLHHKEPDCIHRCKRVIVISLKRCKIRKILHEMELMLSTGNCSRVYDFILTQCIL